MRIAKQKHYTLEVETEGLQTVEEKMEKIFHKKNNFSSQRNSFEAIPKRPSSCAGIAVPDARARLRLVLTLASALEYKNKYTRRIE